MSDTDSMQSGRSDEINDRFGEGAAYWGSEHGKAQPTKNLVCAMTEYLEACDEQQKATRDRILKQKENENKD